MDHFATRERTESRPAGLGRLVRAALVLVVALGTVAFVAAPAPAEQRTGHDGAAVPGALPFELPALLSGSPSGDLLSLTNRARTSRGLKPLAWSGSLASIAQSWSRSMAGKAKDCAIPSLAHNKRLGSQVPGNWTYVGENVGCAAPASASVIFNAWMGSDGHRANILRASFTHIGIGWALTSSGVAFATQDFAAYPVAKTTTTTTTTTTTAPKKTIAAAPSRPAVTATPKPTPKPKPKPKPTPTIEPVTNPNAGLNAGLNAARSASTSPPGATDPSAPAGSGDAPTASDPSLAWGTDADLRTTNWAAPLGVSLLTLLIGGTWILVTRQRRLTR